MVDVCIAAAPFLSVARPALGASALIGELAKAGIEARLDYINMRFADRVGLDICEHVAEKTATHFLIGEWVFSDAIHGGLHAGDRSDYEARMRAYVGEETFVALQQMRSHVPAFIDDMARHLCQSDARIIGFTTSFQQNCASLAIAQAVKALDPARIIVFGGANCDGPMGAALAEAYPFIDHVFQGEADVSFPRFVQQVLNDEAPRSRLVTGTPVMEMDALAVPDFSDYFQTLNHVSFGDRVAPGLLFESSRGCWWGAKHHCTFCGLNGTGMTYRSKSHDRVLDEINQHHTAYGVDLFEAADNIMNMRHVAGIFDRLAEENTDLKFFYEIKSNMRPELMERIAKGGVTWVQPGIESLHDTILEKMNKGVKGLHNVRLLRSCQEIGIKPVWNLLAGFPGETADQYDWMASIMPALEHLDPPTGCSVIRLDRFSPYHNEATEMGYRNVRPAAAYRAVYGLSDAALNEIAYFFEGDAENIPDGGYLDPVSDAISQWRAEHGQDGAMTRSGLPELTLIDAGPVVMLKDTRRISSRPVRILTANQTRVLSDLREPGMPATIMDRAEPLPDPSEPWMDAYRTLLEWAVVIEDSFGHAVSLVCETNRRVHPDADLVTFPGGSISAPVQAASAPVAAAE